MHADRAPFASDRFGRVIPGDRRRRHGRMRVSAYGGPRGVEPGRRGFQSASARAESGGERRTGRPSASRGFGGLLLQHSTPVVTDGNDALRLSTEVARHRAVRPLPWGKDIGPPAVRRAAPVPDNRLPGGNWVDRLQGGHRSLPDGDCSAVRSRKCLPDTRQVVNRAGPPVPSFPTYLCSAVPAATDSSSPPPPPAGE